MQFLIFIKIKHFFISIAIMNFHFVNLSIIKIL